MSIDLIRVHTIDRKVITFNKKYGCSTKDYIEIFYRDESGKRVSVVKFERHFVHRVELIFN